MEEQDSAWPSTRTPSEVDGVPPPDLLYEDMAERAYTAPYELQGLTRDEFRARVNQMTQEAREGQRSTALPPRSPSPPLYLPNEHLRSQHVLMFLHTGTKRAWPQNNLSPT